MTFQVGDFVRSTGEYYPEHAGKKLIVTEKYIHGGYYVSADLEGPWTKDRGTNWFYSPRLLDQLSPWQYKVGDFVTATGYSAHCGEKCVVTRVDDDGYVFVSNKLIGPYIPHEDGNLCYNPEAVTKHIESWKEEPKMKYHYLRIKEPIHGHEAGDIVHPIELNYGWKTGFSFGYFLMKSQYLRCIYKDDDDSQFELVSYDEPLPITDPVLKAWGATYEDLISEFSDSPRGSLHTFISDSLDVSSYNPVLKLFKPHRSTSVLGNIAIYQNKDKAGRDIATSMKPGRAFKAMFPHLTDVEVATLVDRFRAKFPIGNYTLKEGSDAADFKRAYSHDQAPNQNPYTTSARKAIASSCMRYSFKHLTSHPCEAFASGDFKIFWCENEKGQIASRCVVYFPEEKEPQAGPIYGVCEASIDMIEKKLQDISAATFRNSSWEGAKMVKIEAPHGGVIAPYLDGSIQSLHDEGDHLLITENKREDYDASNYEGVLGGDRCTCYECGCRLDEGDAYWGNDYPYCENCYHENFRHCEYYCDDFHVDGGFETVYRVGYGGRRLSEQWCRDAVDSHAIYCDGVDEYWHEDDAVTNTHNNEAISPVEAENDYTLCEETDLYWPNDEIRQLVDGTFVCKEWMLNQEVSYEERSDGRWYEIKEEEEAA